MIFFCRLSFCSILFIVVPAVIAINGCNDNNGGCSDFCLYNPQENITQCACPCGKKLEIDDLNCVNIRNCSLDVYMPVDIGLEVINGCPNSGDMLTAQLWLAQVKAFAVAFASGAIASSDVQLGIQFYSTTTVGSFYTTTAVGVESMFSPLPHPLCESTNNTDVYTHVEFAGNDVASNPAYVYAGPLPGLRSLDTTTAIAIAFVFGFVDESTSDSDILAIRNRVLESFDEIFVITTSHSDTDYDQANTEKARLFACGDSEPQCSNVFWFDRTNDYGVPLSVEAVMNEYNVDDCNLSNLDTTAAEVISCNGSMIFEMSECALKGLDVDEMQYRDPNCNVTALPTSSDGSLRFELNFGDCGMVQEFIVDNGQVKNRFTQTIRTRDFSGSQTLPSVNFNLSCILAAFADEYVAETVLRPDLDIVIGHGATAKNNFTVFMDTYETGLFETPALDNIFVVGCYVYVKATAIVFPNIIIALSSCWATPTADCNDETKYQLADTGCSYPDPTFEPVDPQADICYKFRFKMFEFWEGFGKPPADKPSVFIHCKFLACYNDISLSPECNTTCPSSTRRRREIKEDSNQDTFIASLGPLIVKEADVVDASPPQEPDVVDAAQQDAGVIEAAQQDDDVVDAAQEDADVEAARQDADVIEAAQQDDDVIDAAQQDADVVDAAQQDADVVDAAQQDADVVDEAQQDADVVDAAQQDADVVGKAFQQKPGQVDPIVQQKLDVVDSLSEQKILTNEIPQEKMFSSVRLVMYSDWTMSYLPIMVAMIFLSCSIFYIMYGLYKFQKKTTSFNLPFPAQAMPVDYPVVTSTSLPKYEEACKKEKELPPLYEA